MLADEIKRAAARELIAKLDAGEATLAAHVGSILSPLKPQHDDASRTLLAAFIGWCEGVSARSCAAKPTTITAWIMANAHQGEEKILATLAAIEQMHDFHGLPNPVKTAIVAAALDGVCAIAQPPRSWPKAEKRLFLALPHDIKKIIARREEERDAGLRRAQNAAAEEKKRLNGAEPKPVEFREEVHNGKNLSQHGQA